MTRVLPLFAALAVLTPGGAGPVAAEGPATIDGRLTSVLRESLDARRKTAGLDPLFLRQTYMSQAATIALNLADGGAVREPADGTPTGWVHWTTTEAALATDGREVAAYLTEQLDAVLRYDLHTDGGWAVAVRRHDYGRVTLAAAALVGWPSPPATAVTGCSTAGYCWSTRGLNPHLPWIRNRLYVHLSSPGAPAAAESLLKSAISRLNAAPGFGPDVRYGGRTTATTPGPGHRFVVQWRSSTACSGAVLACTVPTVHGPYKLVVAAHVAVVSSRYAANPSPERWIGTLTHELAHAFGLGHYSSRYGGTYQLMHPVASGVTRLQTGDLNGLRAIARPGRLSVKLTSEAAEFPSGAQARMTVSTTSTGPGGVRSAAIQCVDRFGVLRTAVRATGVWDIRRRDQRFAWTVGSGSAYRTTCRAVATSKTTQGYSAWIRVSFAG